MKIDLDRPLLTVKEVAAQLHCGPMTVYRRLENRTLKGFKLGNRWRVFPDDLQRYLDQLPSNRRLITLQQRRAGK